MRKPTFPGAEFIQIRAERGLREAIHSAAREDRTSASEFLRRELRAILARRGHLSSGEPPQRTAS